jgi:hypothetical protein
MTVVKVGPRIGTINGDGSSDLGRLFLVAFLASCFWFWWLISLIYRFVLDIEDPVSNWSIGISILSAGVFVLAFLLTRARGRPTAFAAETLDRCEGLAYKTTLLLFVPAIGIAVIFFISSVGKSYGQGGQIVLLDQALFYVQLFFGFMFLGVVRSDAQSKRKIWLLMAVLILPRLLVSLDYGRVFVAQAVVPIVFIAVARGFIRLSWKRLSQIVLLGLFILVVPSMTRGDSMFSAAGDPAEANVPQIVNWIAAGSSLQVTQDYLDLDLTHRCPPLLVSLTGKLIPYALLHLCTVRLFGHEMAANLDRDVSYEMVGEGDPADIEGTGTSYLLELYVSGGITALVIGSLLFGFACKHLAISMAERSVFSGIWAECLMRAILAPRGMLGYVFEKVPVLVLATLAIAALGILLKGKTDPAAMAAPWLTKSVSSE